MLRVGKSRAAINMMHFQSRLPKLPIPELGPAADQFLKSVKVHEKFDRKDIEQTERILDSMKSCQGVKDLLVEIRSRDSTNMKDSYITKSLQHRWLSNRKPQFLQAYTVFSKFDPEIPRNQFDMAAHVIMKATKLFLEIKNETFSPILHQHKSDPAAPAMFSPEDMTSWKYLFASSRIPQKDVDKNFTDNDSKHVTVGVCGRLYKIQVLNHKDQLIVDLKTLSKVLWKIHRLATENPKPISPAILTTLPRNEWADVRNYIQLTNADFLTTMESGIFHICLDTKFSEYDNNETLAEAAAFGSGLDNWRDKNSKSIVFGNGRIANNGDHSFTDGRTNMGLTKILGVYTKHKEYRV